MIVTRTVAPGKHQQRVGATNDAGGVAPHRRLAPRPPLGSNHLMLALALAALLPGQPDTAPPILFDAITPKAAAALHGRRVTITFTPAKPAYTTGRGKRLVTWAGPADLDDVERTVVLKGNRMLDADQARERLTVRGTLRVIHHPADTINGVEFEAFTEIRVEE